MTESSIKLINKESLLEQRTKLLEALAETEGILMALGWEPESCSEGLPIVKAVRSRKSSPTVPTQLKISLRDAVLEACREIRDNITRGGVIDHVKRSHPDMDVKDGSVGATLSNLKSDNQIEELERGSGGKPSVFRISSPK